MEKVSISDHFAITVQISVRSSSSGKKQIKVLPFLKDEQAHVSFLNDLHSEIFLVNLEQSVDAAFDNLEEKLTLVVNPNANYKEWKTPRNPRITNAVKNSVAMKAKFFRLFQRFRAPADEQRFKHYRAMVNKLVKASRSNTSQETSTILEFFRQLNALCGREKKAKQYCFTRRKYFAERTGRRR